MIAVNPTYIPLIQKPHCCAIACLQMVLYRNGLGLFDQEQLAIRFGVKIATEDAHAFSAAMQVMTRAGLDEGISTVESADDFNTFFNEISVPLEAKGYKYSTIPNVGAFLMEHLAANNDVWIEYHAHDIHANDNYKSKHEGDYVHDGLIEGFAPSMNTITVIDPYHDHRQRITVSLTEIEKAVSSLFGKETGFVIIRNRK
ncbi:MAG: hypothetical protein WC612_06960 [Bdellovibrionales bacterium]|jgi:hypothetical protein